MAPSALPAKLPVVHIICTMAISAHGWHIKFLRRIPLMTGMAINTFMTAFEYEVRLQIVIKLPQ